MTINDSRLLKGTLTFGTTGTEADAEGQITNLIVEQQDGDSEDEVTVLSGETAGGGSLPGAWHITGTLIQDFDAATSLQKWSYTNRGTEQSFTFVPNDSTSAPTITGTVYVKFLGLGGDTKVRLTRDFDWAIKGDPDFGSWEPASPLVASSEQTSGAYEGVG